ncbi:DUF3857 domain-containing protein [uncultured Xylophilus sp.]|uniref:DUF3857 domain-containing protein n=1 Tax=uncultured Xylophilus sp. TaxID=296832 RepID=UPI0025EDD804|nr:DUF3857 domain-containing protein [uncultured Xylophilus sp.]
MTYSRAFLACAIVVAALHAVRPAAAQALQTVAGHLKIVRSEALWKVNTDATTVLETLTENEALSVEGAQAATKAVQMVNRSLQRFEVLEAYTLKADGRKLPVGTAGLQVQRGVASGGNGPSWPGADLVQITFPDVQKGDRTLWRARMSTHVPNLSGVAEYQRVLPPLLAVESFRARLEAPRSLDLQVFASGLDVVEQQSEDDAVRVWEVRGRMEPAVIDQSPLDLRSRSPRLFASTLRNPEQLADAYVRAASGKALISDEARMLAAQIVEGKSGTADKAAAVHDWVRKNIRYVAVYLGVGGWVPHDVDWILKNRYGDCKDHVLLTQVLLRAAGIDAVPALINTGADYTLPELPVGFNHVVVYIPALDLFADPTSAQTPFGRLPIQDADKPVAVGFAGGGRQMRTPAFAPQDNRTATRTVLSIDKTGTATGQVDIETAGFAASQLQARLQAIPAPMRAQAAAKLLEAAGRSGSGVMEFGELQRDVQRQSLRIASLQIVNLLPDATAGMVGAHPTLALPVYAGAAIGNHAAASRTYPVLCLPAQVREDFELRFDPAYRITRVPADVDETGPDGIAFKARYVREGNTVRGWRELTLSQPRHSCDPAQYSVRRATAQRIAQHLRSGVLFQQ